MRAKGYAATSVQDLCDTAGVTKGAFFHHFRSKDELGVAAVERWTSRLAGMFDSAPYRQLPDPVARVLGYVEFRRSLLSGDLPKITCLAGTVVQEAYGTHPELRDACNACIRDHAAPLERDIADAMAARKLAPDWTAGSLAGFILSVVHGAFVLAKATGGPEVAAQSLDHLRRYLDCVFRAAPAEAGT
jgi:TetR/AcrR family transcriptional repressor of nem operon